MESRALATIGTGPYAELLAHSGESFRRYALKHGYEYVQGSGAMPDARPPAWAKIPLLRHLLESFDVVVWIDADAIILDDSRDISSELEDGAWQAMVAHRWRENLMPNNGVWVLRQSTRAHDFLEAVWNSVGLVDHVWWDNAAVVRLLGFTLESPVRLVDPAAPWLEGTQWLTEDWNRLTYYGRRLDRGRIRHLAGESSTIRSRQIRADAAGLDGKRIRPAIAHIEWSLRRAGLGKAEIRSAIGRLVWSLHQRAGSHPLWYPYLLYRAIKKTYRTTGKKQPDSPGAARDGTVHTDRRIAT